VRVLLIEETADGLLDLAIRAWRHGHDVRYHVGSFDRGKHPTGMGLVERVADWRVFPALAGMNQGLGMSEGG
jgi:hypothetical protein